MAKTLATLKTEVRDICDEDVAGFITDNQLGRWLNSSLGRLHDLVVDVNPQMLMERDAYQITTTANEDTYELPEIKKIVAVDYYDGSLYHHISIAPMLERNLYQSNSPYYPPVSDYQWRYISVKNGIKIIPTPTSSYIFYIWYVKKYENLNDSDNVSDAIEDEWLDWAVYDTAIKVSIRNEDNPQFFMALKSDLEQKIRQYASRNLLGLHYAPDAHRSHWEWHNE